MKDRQLGTSGVRCTEAQLQDQVCREHSCKANEQEQVSEVTCTLTDAIPDIFSSSTSSGQTLGLSSGLQRVTLKYTVIKCLQFNRN